MQKHVELTNSTIQIKPLRTEQDYETALQRMEAIFDASPHSPEGEEAEVLAILIEHFESKHYPIEAPDPIEAIKIRMEDMGLKQKDLVGLIGSKSRVSEILSRKKRLTVEMIRILSDRLRISPEVLIREYELT